MPRPEEPTRFLVTGLPRSGTNLILHSLAFHPEVLAYNELFNPDRMLWGSSEVDKERHDAFLELRATRPVHFIEHVLSPEHPEIRAVGFKLFYMHGAPAERESYRLVWPWLRRMEGLRVVDVVRKNKLKQIFSWFLAQETQVWVRKGESLPQPPQSIALPFDVVNGYFHWYEDMEKLRARQLEGMDVLELDYETLAADFAAHMARIQEHLGVPVLPLAPAIRKQRTAHINEVLINYWELRDRFVQTPHIKYFEMAEEDASCRSAAA
ncbi:MAG: sulfotransferase [Thermodesulfobacteriota bacterium]